MKYIIIGIGISISIIIIIFIISFNKKDKKIENIKNLYFRYSTGTYMNASVSYEIKCDDKCLIYIKEDEKSEDETKEYQLSLEDMKKIEDILNEYNVIKWNGFHKYDKNVLDGNSFSFGLSLDDGTSISASGYMMYPKNYREVKRELEKIFASISTLS